MLSDPEHSKKMGIDSLGLSERVLGELSKAHMREFGRPMESVGDLLEVLE